MIVGQPSKYPQKCFLIGQVPILKYGLKTLILLLIEKEFFEVLPRVTKLILSHTVVVLCITQHIKLACLVTGGGGGVGCQNAQKQFIIKAQ